MLEREQSARATFVQWYAAMGLWWGSEASIYIYIYIYVNGLLHNIACSKPVCYFYLLVAACTSCILAFDSTSSTNMTPLINKAAAKALRRKCCRRLGTCDVVGKWGQYAQMDSIVLSGILRDYIWSVQEAKGDVEGLAAAATGDSRKPLEVGGKGLLYFSMIIVGKWNWLDSLAGTIVAPWPL